MRVEARSSAAGAGLILVLVGLTAAAGMLLAHERHAYERLEFVIGDVALAIAIAAYVRARRRVIVVDDQGIEARYLFGNRSIRWDDVAHYFYWSTDENPFDRASRYHPWVWAIQTVDGRPECGSLRIVTHGGVHVVIDHRYVDCTELLAAAFAHLHPRLRQGPADFAPFVLTGTELSHDVAGALPLSAIASVALLRHCVVRRDKKLLAWARVRTNRVRNSMLFVEELRARGVQASVASGMYVPPLRADVAGSRPAALPAAKTVQR